MGGPNCQSEEISWCEGVPPCEDALTFVKEYIWVVISAGLKNQVAVKIYNKVMEALERSVKAETVYNHHGKCYAINLMWVQYRKMFINYQRASDKIKFLRTLPWIGDITKYHLARNLGLDYVKPDRHLVRIAQAEGKTPDTLCRELSKETGYRIGTVDVILWRAANLGII